MKGLSVLQLQIYFVKVVILFIPHT